VIDLDTGSIKWAINEQYKNRELFGPFLNLRLDLSTYLKRNLYKSDDFQNNLDFKIDFKINENVMRLAFLKCYSSLLSGYRLNMHYAMTIPFSRTDFQNGVFFETKDENLKSFLKIFFSSQSFHSFLNNHTEIVCEIFDWIQYNQAEKKSFDKFISFYLSNLDSIPTFEVIKVEPKKSQENSENTPNFVDIKIDPSLFDMELLDKVAVIKEKSQVALLKNYYDKITKYHQKFSMLGTQKFLFSRQSQKNFHQKSLMYYFFNFLFIFYLFFIFYFYCINF
jgi:hypothetical protein